AHGLLGQHRVHGEMLADIAQELCQRPGAQPGDVVGQDGRVGSVEGQEVADLVTQARHVRRRLLGGQQSALLAAPARIAEPVPPPTRAIPVGPSRWKCDSTIRWIMWPTCRLAAVGSKPQYTVRCSLAAASSRPVSVIWCTRPRACRRSTTLSAVLVATCMEDS